jgi:hypothetical protein
VRTVEFNRKLLWGGVALFGAGGLLCAAGATLGLAAVVGATRRWVGELEEPPTQMARRRWTQAKTATMAGVDAWRHDHGSVSSDKPSRRLGV